MIDDLYHVFRKCFSFRFSKNAAMPASSQSPLDFVSAFGENSTRSLAPPLPGETSGLTGDPKTRAWRGT